MRLGNGRQISQRHIGNTLTDKYIPLSDQIERLFEWHLDVVGSLCLLPVDLLGEGKSDVSLEVLPLGVAFLHRLVVQAEVVDDDLLDALRVRPLQPQIEQATLLSQEPFSELFVSAVGKSADEVRNVVVFAGFHLVGLRSVAKCELASCISHILAFVG